MPNYFYTDKPGTSRYRAKNINLNNPSDPAILPSITFSIEERIIMADGSEVLVDRGSFVVNIADLLQKSYNRINTKNGKIKGIPRTGLELFTMFSEAMSDVFIAEAMERDGVAINAQ